MRRELAFVYGLTFLGMASPALLLLLLVHLLSPGAYGRLAAVQGVAVFLGVLADFGLIYSGAAAVAAARDRPAVLGETVAAGLALRTVSAGLAALLALFLLRANPLLHGEPTLPALGALLTLAYALSPAWVLWGLDRQRDLALAEHGPRMLLLFLVALAEGLTNGLAPATVLALQTAGTTGVYLVLWLTLGPAVPLQRPQVQRLRELGRDTLRLLLYRLFAAGFSNLNAYVLGLVASPGAVGAFAAAERIVRAGLQLFEPLLRYYLPKLKAGGASLERRLLAGLAGLAAGFWLTLQLAAGPILSLVLGPRFLTGDGEVQRVFSLLSFLLLLHPLSKARLLAGVFARAESRRALALEAAAFAAYLFAVAALYLARRLNPVTLALALVGVEGLLLLLANLYSREG